MPLQVQGNDKTKVKVYGGVKTKPNVQRVRAQLRVKNNYKIRR